MASRNHFVASRNRWLECLGQRPAQQERSHSDLFWTEACEGIARIMLKYLEDSEITKVSKRELEEQVLSPNEPWINVVPIARLARNETKEKLFQIFRQREGEVFIASKARWDVQLKGLVEVERRCQSFRADVEYLCERREVLKYLVVSKKDMQRTAPEDSQSKNYEELKELEEQRAKEAFVLVQKKHKLIKWEGERERTRTMQRLEATRTMSPWSGHARPSFGSCSSSLAP